MGCLNREKKLLYKSYYIIKKNIYIEDLNWYIYFKYIMYLKYMLYLKYKRLLYYFILFVFYYEIAKFYY